MTLIHCYGHAMQFRDWATLIILIVIIAFALLLLFEGVTPYTDTP